MFGAINAFRKSHQSRPIEPQTSLQVGRYCDLSSMAEKVYTKGNFMHDGAALKLPGRILRGTPFTIQVEVNIDCVSRENIQRYQLYLVYSLETKDQGVLVSRKEKLTSEKYQLDNVVSAEHDCLVEVIAVLHKKYPISCQTSRFNCKYYCVLDMFGPKGNFKVVKEFWLKKEKERELQFHKELVSKEYAVRRCFENSEFQLTACAATNFINVKRPLSLSLECKSELQISGTVLVQIRYKLQTLHQQSCDQVFDDVLHEQRVKFKNGPTEVVVEAGSLRKVLEDENWEYKMFTYVELGDVEVAASCLSVAPKEGSGLHHRKIFLIEDKPAQ